MKGDAGVNAGDDTGRPMRRTYVAVLLVEVVVLIALWAFGAYFGPM